MLYGLVVAAAVASLLATRSLARRRGAWPVREWLPWWLGAIILAPILATARDYADNLGFPVHGAEVEESLFGSLPTVWLQDRLYSAWPGVSAWASLIVHASWFVVPWCAAALVTLRKGNRIGSFFRWWFGLYVVALPIFALFPLEPPWMAGEGVTRLITLVIGEVEDANSLAAMPSLHVAFPLVISLWFLREGWLRPAFAMLVYSGLVSFEVVFSGEHYVVDVMGGAVVALVVALAARMDYAWLLNAVWWRPRVATKTREYGSITLVASGNEVEGR